LWFWEYSIGKPGNDEGGIVGEGKMIRVSKKVKRM